MRVCVGKHTMCVGLLYAAGMCAGGGVTAGSLLVAVAVATGRLVVFVAGRRQHWRVSLLLKVQVKGM